MARTLLATICVDDGAHEVWGGAGEELIAPGAPWAQPATGEKTSTENATARIFLETPGYLVSTWFRLSSFVYLIFPPDWTDPNI